MVLEGQGMGSITGGTGESLGVLFLLLFLILLPLFQSVIPLLRTYFKVFFLA